MSQQHWVCKYFLLVKHKRDGGKGVGKCVSFYSKNISGCEKSVQNFIVFILFPEVTFVHSKFA